MNAQRAGIRVFAEAPRNGNFRAFGGRLAIFAGGRRTVVPADQVFKLLAALRAAEIIDRHLRWTLSLSLRSARFDRTIRVTKQAGKLTRKPGNGFAQLRQSAGDRLIR
jgi:hypothetical protein